MSHKNIFPPVQQSSTEAGPIAQNMQLRWLAQNQLKISSWNCQCMYLCNHSSLFQQLDFQLYFKEERKAIGRLMGSFSLVMLELRGKHEFLPNFEGDYVFLLYFMLII